MELGLSGKVAVVTGGAGIGWACARMLAREGCGVSVWDSSRKTEEQAAAHDVVVDVSDWAAVENALRETEAALGPVSHLVHAAAIGSGKFGFPFTNLQPGDWLKVLEVNVMGMVHVAHAVAPGIGSPPIPRLAQRT